MYKDAVHNYTATYSADLSDVSQLTTFINTAMGTSLSDGDCLDSLRKCSLLHEGLLFSGDGTYADVGDNPQYYTGTADFTAEAWFNTQTVSDQTIISTAIDVPGGLNGFQLLLYNSNRVLIAAYDGVGYQEIITDNSISLNEWHHVVAQRIGNDANNYKIYVDGVEMTVQPMPTNISFGTGDISNYALSTLKIGCRESNIRPFDGYIKEARLYKRILSGGEVVYNYNNGCMPMLQDTTSLLLHAILNETAGTTSWTEQSSYAESCGLYGGGADFSKHEMTGCVTCGRTFVYKYGMNGQEKDLEIAEGIYTAEFWEYDSRLGRRWNTDPVVKVWESPYACFSNNSVWFTDVNGADATQNRDKGKKDESTEPVITGNNKVGYTLPEISIKAENTGFLSKVGDWFKGAGKSIKDSYVSIATKADNLIHKLGENFVIWGTAHSQEPGKKAPLPDNPIEIDMSEILDYLDPIKVNHDNQVTIPYKWPTKGEGKGEDKANDTKKKFYEQDEDGTKPVLKKVDSTDVIYQTAECKQIIRVPDKPIDPQDVNGLVKSGPKKGKVVNVFKNTLK